MPKPGKNNPPEATLEKDSCTARNTITDVNVSANEFFTFETHLNGVFAT